MRTRILAVLILPLLSAGLLAGEGEKEREGPAQRVVSERDRDGDGRLSADELGAGDFVFGILDRDGDGFVTARELAEARRERARRGGRGPGKRGDDAAGPGDREARARQMAERLLERLDRDGDGRITADEAPEGRLDVSRADRDGDGAVDLAELTEALGRRMRERGPGAADGPGGGERMMRALRQWDANGDGSLQRDEWKGPAQAFDRIDADRDGSLSKKELQAVSRRGGEGRRGRAEALLRRADEDGDGRISAEEWPLRAELFGRFDRDGDGFVTREELTPRWRRGPRERYDTRSGKDSEAFMAKWDRNRDGAVTPDEFSNEVRFAEIDADSDGKLTLAEVGESMAKRAGESKFGFFERFDLNGDRKVTRDEFTGPARMFERYDRNNDGIVDASDEPDAR